MLKTETIFLESKIVNEYDLTSGWLIILGDSRMKTFLVALTLFCVGVFGEEKKPDPVAVVQPVEVQKVFKLITRKNWEKQWTATAFFISPTRLVTAAHTFEKSNDQWILKDGKEVHCRVVKIDFKKDIAVLESDEACESYYRLVSTIRLIGSPHGNPVEEHTGYVDSSRIHARCYFVAGMSGCPMVNEYGDVEAMGVQGDIGGDDKDCRAIPASTLAKFVESAK